MGHYNTTGNALTQYLKISFTAGDTTIEIDKDGAGIFNTATTKADHNIVVENIDLTTSTLDELRTNGYLEVLPWNVSLNFEETVSTTFPFTIGTVSVADRPANITYSAPPGYSLLAGELKKLTGTLPFTDSITVKIEDSNNSNIYKLKTFNLILGTNGANTLSSPLTLTQTTLGTGLGPIELTLGEYMGIDEYIAGFDDDDTLVGDINTIDASAVLLNGHQQNIVTGGNDLLDGGSGSDTLIGDVMTVTAKKLTSQSAENIIKGGDDILKGSAGADTLIVGDVKTMSAEAGDFAYAKNIFKGGNDTLEGGAGDDAFIVGDLYEVTAKVPTDSQLNSTAINIITGGNDQIDGNAGADTLIGDVGMATANGHSTKPPAGSDFFLFATHAENIIFGGHDALRGGSEIDLIIGDVQTIKAEATINGGESGSTYAKNWSEI